MLYGQGRLGQSGFGQAWRAAALQVMLFLEVERHLTAQCGISRSPFVLDSVLVHSHLGATLQSAGPALVAVGLVDDARALCFGLANVLPITSNGSLQDEETTKLDII